MGLNKLIERLYLKVFVGIAVSHDKTDVVVELSKGSEVKERIAKSFEQEKRSEVAEFLAPYLAESPFYYIALLNCIEEQGAVPVCSEKEAREFFDTTTAITLCQDKKWMVYASKPALDAMQKEFKAFGVDFIFSPFSIIKRFFADKIDSVSALYVLMEEDAVSVAYFGDGDMLFGRRLAIAKAHELGDSDHDDDHVSLSFEIDVDGIEEGLDLEDINAIDDLEGLDDLQEIEDLDAIDELESFTEEFHTSSRDDEKETEEVENSEPSEFSLKELGKDYKRFQLIQTALQHYYTDEKYDNRFVEAIYVADGCGVSDDLKNYLEEELFVKVYVRRIDIAAEVVDLAKEEVDHAS